jgi:HPt (histidine-containing phosphotransfer) domain-containing protein
MGEAIIDRTTFDNLTQLVGADFIGELVATFFEETPGLLAEMSQALDEGDGEAFRRATHSLKSNSASFGAMPLAALARELEFMGRDGQLDEAAAKLPALETAYEQTVEALKALL